MLNKSMVKMVLMAFSLMLAFSLGAYAQKTDCSKMTDPEIIDAIYASVNVKYADQTNHINIRIKEGVVTVEGWATTKNVKKDIEKAAKKIKCVKQVVNELTIGKSGGCAPGQKPCGDICIDAAETCNIRSGKGN